jgi:hypothetical protein
MKKSTLIAEFDQAVHIVDSSFPSLYTKDDVIKVLRDLETTLKDFIGSDEETTTKDAIDEAQIREIAENAASSIVFEGMDIVDDYDLSMNYKEVELDSITLDESRVAKEIERAIADWFDANRDNN